MKVLVGLGLIVFARKGIKIMEAFQLIAAICSIVSLFISIFVASKVITIGNKINVKGDGNTTIGRDYKKG